MIVQDVAVQIIENPTPKTIHATHVISDAQPLKTTKHEPFYTPFVQKGRRVQKAASYTYRCVRSGHAHFRGNN